MLLACAPVAYCLLPADIRILPLMWALASITIGQSMLLGIWAALGLSRFTWRLITALLAGAYLAIWPPLGLQLRDPSEASLGGYFSELCQNLLGVFVMIGLAAAAFLVVRRWFSELRLMTEDEDYAPGKMQYSIFSLLVITTVAALLLGLARAARPAESNDWRVGAATVLMLACLLIDVLCAVWAALGSGRIRWRMAVVMMVAGLLGVLNAIISGSAALAWWLAPGWVLASLLTPATVIASLLVVRAQGYRLVAKRRG
ncbi:MAG TPA: hypothetical protein VF278_10085 [Pirellulales bacterium]